MAVYFTCSSSLKSKTTTGHNGRLMFARKINITILIIAIYGDEVLPHEIIKSTRMQRQIVSFPLGRNQNNQYDSSKSHFRSFEKIKVRDFETYVADIKMLLSNLYRFLQYIFKKF